MLLPPASGSRLSSLPNIRFIEAFIVLDYIVVVSRSSRLFANKLGLLILIEATTPAGCLLASGTNVFAQAACSSY